MSFSDLLRAMRRKWYWVLFGLLATSGLCIGATGVVPPTYQAQASVLLLPATSDDDEGANPYLSLGGLQPATDTVGRAMADSTVKAGLEQAGMSGEYEIKTDTTTSAPVLLVTATATTPSATLQSLELVLAQVPVVVADMQTKASVPESAQLVSSVIALDQQAKLVLKSRLRVLAVAVALGLSLTFGVVVFADSRARQRAFGRSQAIRAPQLDGRIPAGDGQEELRGWTDGHITDQSRASALPTDLADRDQSTSSVHSEQPDQPARPLRAAQPDQSVLAINIKPTEPPVSHIGAKSDKSKAPIRALEPAQDEPPHILVVGADQHAPRTNEAQPDLAEPPADPDAASSGR